MLPRRPQTAALTTMLSLLLAIAPSASALAAQDSGTLAVTGSSVETVRFSVGDALGELRAHLGPEGPAERQDGRPGVVEFTGPDASVCYAVSAEVRVSSNAEYDLLVAGDDHNAGLHFLSGRPHSFAACLAGEPATSAMFVFAPRPGGWVLQQPRTAERAHPFALGLVVRPGEDALAVLANSSLSVLARPAS